ncbi:MAG: sporulation initiation factor Spo0A C-terminal domain-containing protein [Ruminococcus sp.]
MAKIDLILIEDDIKTCNEYKTRIPYYGQLILTGITSDAEEAIEIIKKQPPTAIVLDLELHKGKGNGLSFLMELNKLNLPKKPFVLVVTNNISTVTHSAARNLGADFVITKNQNDYSVEMILNFLLTLEGTGVTLDSPKTNRTVSEFKSSISYIEKMQDQINKELDSIGVSPKLKGRQYLRDAIELTCNKKRSNLCAEIAKSYSKTDASVERAMQTAINHAWHNTDIETLEKNYTAYINPRKGVPTVTEFIYYYADKVKRTI